MTKNQKLLQGEKLDESANWTNIYAYITARAEEIPKYITLRREDRQDILQTVASQLWIKRKNFQPEKFEKRGAESLLKGWSRRLLRNAIYRHLFKESRLYRNSTFFNSDVLEDFLETTGIEPKYSLSTVLREVAESIPTLKHRHAFLLVEFENYSRKEAAEMLGTNMNTFTSRFISGRQHFYSELRADVLLWENDSSYSFDQQPIKTLKEPHDPLYEHSIFMEMKTPEYEYIRKP